MNKKKQVKDLIEKYKEKLCLQLWDITFKLSGEKSETNATAKINVNEVYRSAHITVFKDAFNEEEDIDHIIKHELCHCMTQKFVDMGYDLLNAKFRTHLEIEDEKEKLTEWIARVVK